MEMCQCICEGEVMYRVRHTRQAKAMCQCTRGEGRFICEIEGTVTLEVKLRGQSRKESSCHTKNMSCHTKNMWRVFLDTKGIQKSRAIVILGTRDDKNICDVKMIYKVYTWHPSKRDTCFFWTYIKIIWSHEDTKTCVIKFWSGCAYPDNAWRPKKRVIGFSCQHVLCMTAYESDDSI